MRSHRAIVKARGCGFIAALDDGQALTPKTMLEGLVADPRRGRDRRAFVTSSLLPILSFISHHGIDELFDCIRRGLDRLWD
jgi:hypothetical protein